MIDEKKLIDDLLHNDGMQFEVTVKDCTPESLVNAFQEFTNKMKEGFVDLIKSQPSFGWRRVEETPEVGVIILLTDGNSTDVGMSADIGEFDTDYGFCDSCDITHWMPLPEPPKDGEP